MKWKVIIPVILITALTLTTPGSLAEDIPNASEGTVTTNISTEQNIPQEQPGPPTINFAFAGDVLLERCIENLINKYGKDYIFAETKDYFKAADISMINLETPVSTRGTKEKDKQFTFRANPATLPIITAAGINTVSLGNNHAIDFGKLALLDTFKHLDKEKLVYAGAGQNQEKAYAPKYMERKGLKIAIIAASRVIPFMSWYAGKNAAGIASTYNPAEIQKSIALARKNSDIVVVYVHWGKERAEKPEKYQSYLAKLYIDSGADMVIGSHPHVLQGLEFYKGKLIAYSLGNFIFSDKKKDTMILNVAVKEGKIESVNFVPCRITTYRPLLIKNQSEIKLFLDKMRKLSINTTIDEKGLVKQSK